MQLFYINKMNFYKKFVLCLPALFIVQLNFATTYTAISSGDWDADATWSGTGIPGLADDVVIEDGKTIHVNIADAACNAMNLGTGGLLDANCTLIFDSGSQLTVTDLVTIGSLVPLGIIDMSNGGVFISSAWNVTNGNFIYGTGTVVFSGTFTLPNHANFSQFYNLEIISGTTQLGRATTIHADLNLSGTGILDAEGQSLTVQGNWTQSGSGVFEEESQTVTFSGFSNQYINHTGTQSFYHLVVDKPTGSLVLNTGNLDVTNLLTINNGTFDLKTNSLTGAGGLTMNNGDLQIGELSSDCGCVLPALSGPYTLSGGTITFKGSGAQTIRSKTGSSPIVTNYYNLMLKGSGTKSLQGDLDINASLYITENAELDVSTSNGNIFIGDNWVNTSTYPDAFNERNGTVIFDGSGPPMLTSTSTLSGETFYNLTMNTAASENDLILNNDITVTNQLTLTRGRIITATHGFTLDSNALPVAGGNNDSFVDGAVIKHTTSTTPYVLPVGKIIPNAEYRWIEITPSASTATTYVAEYFYTTPQENTDVGPGVNRVSDIEEWTLLRTSGTADAKVKLSWTINSVVNTNTTDLLVVQDDGSAGPRWINQCGCTTSGTTSAGVIETNGYITLFGADHPITFGSPHPENNELGITRYSVSSGNWDDSTIWATRTGGPSGATVPTNLKRVVIEGGKRVDVNVAGTALRLTVGNNGGGTLDFNSSDNDLVVGDEGIIINSIGDVEGTNSAAELKTSGDITLNSDISTESGGGNSELTVVRELTDGKTFSGSGTLSNYVNNASTILTGNIAITESFSGSSTLINAGTISLKGTVDEITGNMDILTYPNTIEFDNNDPNFDFTSISTDYHHLTLKGSAVKQPSADWTVNGNLTIHSGVTLDQSTNDNNITVKGDWVNLGGTFTPSANPVTAVTLAGRSQQAVTAAGSIFGNLVVNNSSLTGIVLLDNATVEQKLTLIDGYVYLGNNNLTLLSGSALNPATPSATSFVVTNGVGAMAIDGVSGSRIFPVGSQGLVNEYTPVTIDNTGGVADRYTVKVCDNIYTDGNCSGGILIPNRAVNKTWNISEGVAGGSSVDLTLQWNAAQELSGFDRTACFISHYTGGKWVGQQTYGSASGSGPYTRKVTNLTGNFSPFGVGSAGSPLPVELLQFNAIRSGNAVIISWITASEKNNDHFLIERTTDGIHFTTIAHVKGAGNSNEKITYTVTDQAPLPGISYYRLKQVDNDGKYEVSELEEVIFETSDQELAFSVYPNPATAQVFLKFYSIEKGQPLLITVYDLMGKVVFSQTVVPEKSNDHVIAIDIAGQLPAGMYVIAASSAYKGEQKKLIVRSSE
jgi:hypothetical protein